MAGTGASPEALHGKRQPGSAPKGAPTGRSHAAGAFDHSNLLGAVSDSDGGASDEPPPANCQYVTVMLRNLPNNYSRAILLELIDSEGFAGQYDFFYLPMDFKSRASLGYAFVNLVSPAQAHAFREHFDGFSRWVLPSQKVCSVNWSTPYQGLEAHVERFRNSPVMHEAVPDEYKPVVFVNGIRTSFPPPTKKLRAPRTRRGRGLPATGS